MGVTYAVELGVRSVTGANVRLSETHARTSRIWGVGFGIGINP